MTHDELLDSIEEKAISDGRNMYFEGTHGPEDASDAAARLALVRERDQLLNPWVKVADRMPESGVTVLAFYKNANGLERRIRAEWVKANTRVSSGESEIGVYDEATDTYYDPEGWYEQIDNWDDYTSVVVHQGEITHWMALPQAPKEQG